MAVRIDIGTTTNPRRIVRFIQLKQGTTKADVAALKPSHTFKLSTQDKMKVIMFPKDQEEDDPNEEIARVLSDKQLRVLRLNDVINQNPNFCRITKICMLGTTTNVQVHTLHKYLHQVITVNDLPLAFMLNGLQNYTTAKDLYNALRYRQLYYDKASQLVRTVFNNIIATRLPQEQKPVMMGYINRKQMALVNVRDFDKDKSTLNHEGESDSKSDDEDDDDNINHDETVDESDITDHPIEASLGHAEPMIKQKIYHTPKTKLVPLAGTNQTKEVEIEVDCEDENDFSPSIENQMGKYGSGQLPEDMYNNNNNNNNNNLDNDNIDIDIGLEQQDSTQMEIPIGQTQTPSQSRAQTPRPGTVAVNANDNQDVDITNPANRRNRNRNLDKQEASSDEETIPIEEKDQWMLDCIKLKDRIFKPERNPTTNMKYTKQDFEQFIARNSMSYKNHVLFVRLQSGQRVTVAHELTIAEQNKMTLIRTYAKFNLERPSNYALFNYPPDVPARYVEMIKDFQDNNPENGSHQLQTGLTQQNTTGVNQTQQTLATQPTQRTQPPIGTQPQQRRRPLIRTTHTTRSQTQQQTPLQSRNLSRRLSFNETVQVRELHNIISPQSRRVSTLGIGTELTAPTSTANVGYTDTTQPLAGASDTTATTTTATASTTTTTTPTQPTNTTTTTNVANTSFAFRPNRNSANEDSRIQGYLNIQSQFQSNPQLPPRRSTTRSLTGRIGVEPPPTRQRTGSDLNAQQQQWLGASATGTNNITIDQLNQLERFVASNPMNQNSNTNLNQTNLIQQLIGNYRTQLQQVNQPVVGTSTTSSQTIPPTQTQLTGRTNTTTGAQIAAGGSGDPGDGNGNGDGDDDDGNDNNNNNNNNNNDRAGQGAGGGRPPSGGPPGGGQQPPNQNQQGNVTGQQQQQQQAPPVPPVRDEAKQDQILDRLTTIVGTLVEQKQQPPREYPSEFEKQYQKKEAEMAFQWTGTTMFTGEVGQSQLKLQEYTINWFQDVCQFIIASKIIDDQDRAILVRIIADKSFKKKSLIADRYKTYIQRHSYFNRMSEFLTWVTNQYPITDYIKVVHQRCYDVKEIKSTRWRSQLQEYKNAMAMYEMVKDYTPPLILAKYQISQTQHLINAINSLTNDLRNEIQNHIKYNQLVINSFRVLEDTIQDLATKREQQLFMKHNPWKKGDLSKSRPQGKAVNVTQQQGPPRNTRPASRQNRSNFGDRRGKQRGRGRGNTRGSRGRGRGRARGRGGYGFRGGSRGGNRGRGRGNRGRGRGRGRGIRGRGRGGYRGRGRGRGNRGRGGYNTGRGGKQTGDRNTDSRLRYKNYEKARRDYARNRNKFMEDLAYYVDIFYFNGKCSNCKVNGHHRDDCYTLNKIGFSIKQLLQERYNGQYSINQISIMYDINFGTNYSGYLDRSINNVSNNNNNGNNYSNSDFSSTINNNNNSNSNSNSNSNNNNNSNGNNSSTTRSVNAISFSTSSKSGNKATPRSILSAYNARHNNNSNNNERSRSAQPSGRNHQ